MKQQTGSKYKKDFIKAVYCHPAYLTYMQSTSWKMLGWMKHKLESKLPGEISITSWHHPYCGKWRTKERLDESEKGEWKNWLIAQHSENKDHGIHHFMVPSLHGPITSWQIDGETVETLADFIYLGSKITTDSDWSHEIKRCLLLGRKVMINLDSILKSRDITLPRKVCLLKAMFFSSSHVCMWDLDYRESWVSKNWCFWTVVLEKT